MKHNRPNKKIDAQAEALGNLALQIREQAYTSSDSRALIKEWLYAIRAIKNKKGGSYHAS